MYKRLSVPLLLAAAAWGGLAGGARAGSLIDLEVVSRATGQRLQTYSHRGKTWIAGNPGEAYSVRLTNRSGGRVLAVLSVDGVNAVSGETASARQSGYVLEPWASAEVRGWRKSLEEVAQFYFTSLSDSYAGRTGRPDNVGVIGVAVFSEYHEPRPLPGMQPRLEAPAPGAAAGQSMAKEAARDAEAASTPAESAAPSAKRSRPVPDTRLGTGHGAREHSPTSYTEFRRASETPAEVTTLYYDSHANLVARGIIARTPYYGRPEPFPRDVPGRFVPDPRG